MEQLAKALSAAQAEFGTVPQTGYNPFHKSKYSTIEDYVNAAKPILAKHGLSISQAPNLMESQFVLTTILMHESGEHVVSNQPIFSAKQDAQSMGSAITYARRYAYGAVLGMASGDFDDDGNAAAEKSTEQANPPKTQPPAKSPAPEPPSKDEQGTPISFVNELKEAALAIDNVDELETLYIENKERINDMAVPDVNSVTAMFKQRKAELTRKDK